MDITGFVLTILDFINYTIVPFILALAFLFFLWNAARYFIIQAGSEDAREKAKSLALWGILGFVFIVSLWGIVNLLVFGFGFTRESAITPDYIEESGGPSFGSGGSFGGSYFFEEGRGFGNGGGNTDGSGGSGNGFSDFENENGYDPGGPG